MKDLVLEWRRGGKLDGKVVTAILPNIQGQKYVFGHLYPGEREGEEFFFTRHEKGLLGPTHCAIISVDNKGQYWIQNDTRNVERMTTRSMSSVCVYNTFVNGERVKAVEIRLLKSGDVIASGDPETEGPGGRDRPPTFCVKERTIAGSGSGLQTDDENEASSNSVMCFADSPLANHLIISEVMGFLPIKDLKNARLVSKKWKAEASKHLEKRGKVSFTFRDYQNPENSLKVFRYLHEMRDLKLRTLEIDLQSTWQFRELMKNYQEDSRRSSGQKMMDDLRKLLQSSQNFSTLVLQADLRAESDFLSFFLIFQELGEKLVELKLDIYQLFLPPVLPPFPVMRNLKKLTDTGDMFEMFDGDSSSRWVSHFVPLFSNNLEHFTCDDDPAESYLKEFVNHPMPKLKGFAIKGSVCEGAFSALLELETRLTFLEIWYDKYCPEPEEVLERLLLKNSKSLQHLVIRIDDGDDYNDDPEVKFPSFPMLKTLELEYGREVEISWDTGLSYKKHFPSLRKLTVKPRGRWRNDDQVFNAFFPAEGNLRCETVEEVWIPVMPNDSFQPRIEQIRNMFPKAEKMNFLQ